MKNAGFIPATSDLESVLTSQPRAALARDKDYSFEGVIFDLDGVITTTAKVHSTAWKETFDNYLREREKKHGEPFVEFTHEKDYLKYVDGKPRYQGVKSFLESRGINLPFGTPDDAPELETVCAIGNRKNSVFNDILKRDGVEVFESTVAMMRELRAQGLRVGVASSSKNCAPVLERAGLLDLVEVRIDGVVSAELGLKGKPEADIFTTACDRLGISYDRAVVVEDAVSGVQAGRNGNFGLVIGIAREGNAEELRKHGADVVVEDLSEIGLDDIEQWFAQRLPEDSWKIEYDDYDPKLERVRESLLAVGNGYFCTRGALEETVAGPGNYPGTYMAGVYNRLTSKVADRDTQNEDLVNTINWLPITFKVDDGAWFDINDVEILEIRRALHLHTGLLVRTVRVRHGQGHETRITSRRFASMSDPHLAAMEYTITPLNYSGRITVRAGLHADHINAGVERYKQLNQQHLAGVTQGGDGAKIWVAVKTTESEIAVANACRLAVALGGSTLTPKYTIETSERRSDASFCQHVEEDQTLSVQKIVGIHASRDKGAQELLKQAEQTADGCKSFEEALQSSAQKWQVLWKKMDFIVEGDRLGQKLLRLHLYHMMAAASPHNTRIDASMPARGLHGEGYRGHIFWDELYILPLYDIHFRDIARALLMYRYRRLDAARGYAAEYGYKGAMFPWQSGSDGREETPTIHLNPVSGKWGADHSSLQRHVSLAVAYNIWQYYRITEDLPFIEEYGAEIFFEVCRFWASAAEYDAKTGRYSISRVMGPDEFHEKYKDSEEGGLRDNTYTNIMAAWMFERALDLVSAMSETAMSALSEKIGLGKAELQSWKEISQKLRLVISPEGILSQYDGYFDLKELDWEYYRKKYGNIYRMDRLLKAEGQSADEYKVGKQADVLMLFYNLDRQEVERLIQNMGYELPADYLARNFAYYLARTSHGSTLSRLVHSALGVLIDDMEMSWRLYREALTSDYLDIQGGTTGEGIHAGVMAGTIWIAMGYYGGVNLRSEIVKFDPQLPPTWQRLKFSFNFRGGQYECEINRRQLAVRFTSSERERVRVEVQGVPYLLSAGEWNVLDLKPRVKADAAIAEA